jgi:hypothetical protein
MTADIATPSQIADAEGAVDRESWLERMDEIFDEAGHFEALGHRHWSAFWDESPSVLVVSFERMETIRAATPGKMPFGYAVARSRGWSHLCIIAEGETWFRAPEVYRHFDRLVDDAFFEDFDQVLFYGADMGGYAAAAYSVAAPGATVLAIQPRATLDPALAIWDDRNTAARRLCFTDRYGFAPDMIEGAARVWTVHDPAEHLDAMHAAMFRGPHVTALRGRNLGAQMEQYGRVSVGLSRRTASFGGRGRFGGLIPKPLQTDLTLRRGGRSPPARQDCPQCHWKCAARCLRRPDDWHLHLRDGAMLRAVLPETARHFARAIIMPNLVPPVVTLADARPTATAFWPPCPKA